MILRVVDLTGTSDRMLGLIDSWQKTISEELHKIEMNNPRVFELEHARSHSNRITWRNFQQKVDQARDNALSELRRTMNSSQGGDQGARSEEQSMTNSEGEGQSFNGVETNS